MGHERSHWFEATLAGFLALKAGDALGARNHWQRSRTLSVAGTLRGSPFHAVACNNAMVGEALAGALATVATGDLRAAWEDVLALTGDAELPLPARSTAFHLRLASRHALPYATFLGARARALAALGREMGEANARLCSGAREAAIAGLAGLDQTQAQLPGFLDTGCRLLVSGALTQDAATALLDRQVANIRSYSAGGGLPATFWRQMEAALDFCVFAPCALALIAAPKCDQRELEA